MKSRTALVVILCILPTMLAYGQEVAHQETAVPSDVRYELVQSQIAARFTLKLDKFTGDVYLLVEAKDGSMQWQTVQRASHPEDRTIDGKVNYQLFTSGLAARFTFLMNVNTGATWLLTESSEGYWVWSPIP